jgi:hypothetical protein
MKYKLVISNLIWLKENSDFFIFYRKSFLLPFLKFSFLFQLVDFFKNNNFIFFNLYPFDFFYVRSIYKK